MNHYQFSITLRKIFSLHEDLLPPVIDEIIEFPPLSVNPLLSVVIAHRNGEKYLLDTLKTIAIQSFRDFEVIVIDGASTDGSIDTLRNIPNLRLLSEEDRGIDDAFIKGLNLARGKYVTHCCVSDGYLDVNWFKNAIETLQKNEWASLVWAFPRTLENDKTLTRISYPLLHVMYPPSRIKFFEFWVKTKLPFPEGNYIVNTEVMRVCFPERPIGVQRYSDLTYDPWLKLIINFHKYGYLSLFHNSVANYGRVHEGSITSQTNLDGRDEEILLNYRESVDAIMQDFLNSKTSKSFIDSQGLVVVAHTIKKFVSGLRYLALKIRAIEVFLTSSSFLGRRIDRIFLMIKNPISKILKPPRRD